MIRSRWVRIGIAILAVGVLVEATAAMAIQVINPRLDGALRTRRAILAEQSARIAALLEPDAGRVLELDSVLGWRYRRDREDTLNGSTSWGTRGRRQYSDRPRSGVLRVAAFGDSFTYGNEVADRASWAAQAEQIDPSLEILNYGVGGYGADQAYLRFLSEGSAHGAQVALLGFAPDDLGRLVNVYRRFRSNGELPLFKPRFREQSDGSLALLSNPATGVSFYERLLANPGAVAELGRDDEWFDPVVYRCAWYDRSAAIRLVTGLWLRVHRRYLADNRLLEGEQYNVAAAAFRIQVELFQLFADSARARGQRPVVLFLPDRWTVDQVRGGQAAVYAPLAGALRERGVPFLDAALAFQAAPPPDGDTWFMPGGHYSPAGNRIVAAWIGPVLRAVASTHHGAGTGRSN